MKFKIETIITFIIFFIIVITLSSYKTSDGYEGGGYYHNMVIPIKQTQVINTSDINRVNKLIKFGFVVEFVTTTDSGITRYVLIKY